MRTMLYSIWAAVEENGGRIIENRNKTAKAIEFDSEESAADFIKCAKDAKKWYDALHERVELRQKGARVNLTWPK